MTQAFGAHVPNEDPIAAAKERNIDTIQFFIGDPQSYKKPVLAYPAGPEALKKAGEEEGITFFIHAPYRINVASTNNRIRIPSRKLLEQTLAAAAEIGAAGVIVHGGHLEKDEDPQLGYDNWAKAVAQIDLPVPLLLENTAGGDNAMLRWLEHIDRTWSAVKAADPNDRVGFCLDTCHAFAGGLQLPDATTKILDITGRIDLVHANDSQGDFNSGQDRHANLGTGQIPPADLAEAIALAKAPAVIETRGGLEGQLHDLQWLKDHVGTR